MPRKTSARRRTIRCSQRAARRRGIIGSGFTSARSRSSPATGRSPIAASSSIAKARSARVTTSSISSTSTFRPAKAGANPMSIPPAAESSLPMARRLESSGLTICYDLRFPGLFARLAEAAADVIAVPAAFTVPTGKAHWHILLRARAIEAGLFVVAAAQVGHHQDGRRHVRTFTRGRSLGGCPPRHGRGAGRWLRRHRPQAHLGRSRRAYPRLTTAGLSRRR